MIAIFVESGEHLRLTLVRRPHGSGIKTTNAAEKSTTSHRGPKGLWDLRRSLLPRSTRAQKLSPGKVPAHERFVHDRFHVVYPNLWHFGGAAAPAWPEGVE